MAKKSNKKIFYISLVLLIIIITGAFFYIQKISNPALSDCIKEWKSNHPYPKAYTSDIITVRFTQEVTEQEARQIIQNYGLSVSYSYYNGTFPAYTFDINVPAGSEAKWLCKFQTENPVTVAIAIQPEILQP